MTGNASRVWTAALGGSCQHSAWLDSLGRRRPWPAGVMYGQSDGPYWHPTETMEGCRVLVVPALDPCAPEIIVDCIAFAPQAPAKWRTLTGEGVLLGRVDTDLGLQIFVEPDPLTWLRNGAQGLVILNWKLARPYLVGTPALKLAVGSVADGEHIERQLRPEPTPMPEIVVASRAIRDVEFTA